MDEIRSDPYMKLLFVHQHLGAFGGAEENIYITAKELRQRGHTTALFYADATGRNEPRSLEPFSQCFQLPEPHCPKTLQRLVENYAPDLFFLHSLNDLQVIEALLQLPSPIVRMVHDHTI